MNRKPETEVEIIDECDEFLDSFSNQKNINIDRMQNSMNFVLEANKKAEETLNEIREMLKEIKRDRKIESAIYSKSIVPLKETKLFGVFKEFLNSPELLEGVDDESYLFDVEESIKSFEDFLEESYVIFTKKENNLIASVVTTNLAKKFKELVDKNKIIVLMSGTIHSPIVLKNVFGIEDFKIIEAETEQQGSIDTLRTGLEMDCKYENFSNGKHSRKDYLKALSKCVEISKKPTLIHVNGFVDLPTEEEIKEYGIENLISSEKLKNIQEEDKHGEEIVKFKKGEKDILFSTKTGRGMDFPGEQCNSIIFTKYPNPNVQDPFWKILKQTKPQHYWDFYKDKARRELLQKIYRGLRFKEDHVFLLSPDSRVLDAFERKNKTS